MQIWLWRNKWAAFVVYRIAKLDRLRSIRFQRKTLHPMSNARYAVGGDGLSPD
jgi:hypothetical protein